MGCKHVFSNTQVFCSSSLIAGLKAKWDNLTTRKDPHRLVAFYRATFTLPEKSGPRKRDAPVPGSTSDPPKKPHMDQLVEDIKDITKAGLLQDLARLNSVCPTGDGQ